MFGQVLARPSPVQFKSPVTSLMGGIGAGQQMAARAQQLQQAKQMQPYMVQQAAEKVPFMQAQEQKMQQQAQQGANPMFASTGGGLSGAARSYMYAAHQWGENDPRTQMLKQSYDTQRKAMEERGAYYGSNVGMKYLPTTAKLQKIRTEGLPIGGIGTGAGTRGGVQPSGMAPSQGSASSPSGVRPLNPKEQQEIESKLLTSTQSAQQQKQRLWSAGADKLYNNMTPLIPSVEKFAGFSGSFKQLKDKVESGVFGLTPSDHEDYRKFIKFKNKLPALAKELGRLYGAPSTDEATKAFLKIAVNPAELKWLNPHQVGVLWNNLGELANTGSVASKMSPAQQQQPVTMAQTPVDSQQNAQQGQQQGGMVAIMSPSGKTVSVGSNVAQKLMSQGWRAQ